MKITYKDNPINKKVAARDIPTGTVFSGFIGNRCGIHEDERRLFMKVYSYIVDLEDPIRTWSELGSPSYIYHYEELDAEVVVSQPKHSTTK